MWQKFGRSVQDLQREDDGARSAELAAQAPDQQVEDAYKSLAAEPGDWVSLTDLRGFLQASLFLGVAYWAPWQRTLPGD